jgi:DNA invertase Pin-like site-specific DNA recombinase
MLIGYCRTSTVDQKAGLDAQIAQLKAVGVEELFVEQVSSIQRREELEKALKFIRKGDSLLITKLDRLARSIPDLVRIIETLEVKQATLRILAMNLDTSTPTGRLLLNLVGSISQFEREIMLERQREGVARARSEGKYRGRAPTARAKSEAVVARFKADQRPSEIAKSVGISRASVYRILNEAGLVVKALTADERTASGLLRPRRCLPPNPILLEVESGCRGESL